MRFKPEMPESSVHMTSRGEVPGHAYDVAIVGFGPTGALAANLLGRQGLAVRVYDRSREVYDRPRAIAMDADVLRLFQQLGMEQEIADHVQPFEQPDFFGADGLLIDRIRMPSGPQPQGYPASNVFRQPPVESALRASVASLANVHVTLGAEVTGLVQDDTGVDIASVDDGGRASRVRARYVVACDGAGSAVREWLGIPLRDLEFDEPWLVVDLMVNERGLRKLPVRSAQYCEPGRPCSFIVGTGHHRRFEISLRHDEDPREISEAAATWKLLSRWLTPDDAELWRRACYRFHALVAEQWRRGRIFLAGDAAHQQPPFLGQGMCQGARDVANLAWKLGVSLRGLATTAAADALLDSYEAERRLHTARLIQVVKDIGAVICERDPRRALARDASMRAAFSGGSPPVPELIPRLETGILSTQPHPANGTSFPQPWLIVEGQTVRFDRHAGDGWCLVLAEPHFPLPSGIDTFASLRVIRFGGDIVETEGIAAAWFSRHACHAALVRPDRHVFGVADRSQGVDALIAGAGVYLG